MVDLPACLCMAKQRFRLPHVWTKVASGLIVFRPKSSSFFCQGRGSLGNRGVLPPRVEDCGKPVRSNDRVGLAKSLIWRNPGDGGGRKGWRAFALPQTGPFDRRVLYEYLSSAWSFPRRTTNRGPGNFAFWKDGTWGAV